MNAIQFGQRHVDAACVNGAADSPFSSTGAQCSGLVLTVEFRARRCLCSELKDCSLHPWHTAALLSVSQQAVVSALRNSALGPLTSKTLRGCEV